MRILVTGANGMVGTALKQVIKDSGFEVLYTDKDTLDVRDYHNVQQFKGYDFIVHLGAETDLETCEKDPSHAYFTNTIGTINMCSLAEKISCPILFMSTAGVFDGQKAGAYFPYEVPNPINHYGMSKYFAEKYISEYPYAYILRAGWMMGGGKNIDKKFVNKLIKKIEAGEKNIKVVADCFGAPTYTVDLCNNIKKILFGGFRPGIYHCTNKGTASRYNVALEIVNILGVDVNIIPVLSEKVVKEFPCQRSRNEILSISEGFDMPDWKDSLREYINANFRY